MSGGDTRSPRNGPHLRRACRGDIPAMHALRMSVRENRLVSTVLGEADYVEYLEMLGRGWVAENDGRIVGLVIANAREGSIWGLFVDPEFEGRGLGRRLLDKAVTWLWSRGLSRLWLTTEPDTRADGFYRAAGWSPTERIPSGELKFELLRGTRR